MNLLCDMYNKPSNPLFIFLRISNKIHSSPTVREKQQIHIWKCMYKPIFVKKYPDSWIMEYKKKLNYSIMLTLAEIAVSVVRCRGYLSSHVRNQARTHTPSYSICYCWSLAYSAMTTRTERTMCWPMWHIHSPTTFGRYDRMCRCVRFHLNKMNYAFVRTPLWRDGTDLAQFAYTHRIWKNALHAAEACSMAIAAVGDDNL